MKDKQKVGLEHNSISPDITGIENNYSQHLHLIRGIDSFLTVYVDESIRKVNFNNSKHNIAFLVEPITVSPHLYGWIKDNHQNFDMVITHHKPLLQIDPKFKYYPVWPRIKMDRQYWSLYEKPLHTSAIFSSKRSTEPQKFRHIVAERFRDRLDLFGTGYQFLEDKIHGTGNYKYQVVIENIFSGYTSEKANDCFACGTIPIYYGNAESNINDFYNKEGFLLFTSLDELEHIMNNIATEDYYHSKKEAISENYKLAIENDVHAVLWNSGVNSFFS